MFLAWFAFVAVGNPHRVLFELRALPAILSSPFLASASTQSFAFRRVGPYATNIGYVVLLWNVLVLLWHKDVVSVQVNTSRFITPWSIASVNSIDSSLTFDLPGDRICLSPCPGFSRFWKASLVLWISWIHCFIPSDLVSCMGTNSCQVLQKQLLLAFLDAHLFKVCQLSFPS